MSNKNIKTVDQIVIRDNNLMMSIYAEVFIRDGEIIHNNIETCLKNKHPPLIFEAETYNIYAEYMAMTRFIKQGGFRDNYQKGRYRVLEYILNCIIADPIEGDYYEKKNNELIEEAGRLLNTDNAMWDGLVWSFVPTRLKRTIDMMWDGIGDWRS